MLDIHERSSRICSNNQL